jgi:fumarate hydratase class II
MWRGQSLGTDGVFCLQVATLTLGQEFSGYVCQVAYSVERDQRLPTS